MSVLLIAGSPSERSRTVVLQPTGQRSQTRCVQVQRLRISVTQNQAQHHACWRGDVSGQLACRHHINAQLVIQFGLDTKPR